MRYGVIRAPRSPPAGRVGPVRRSIRTMPIAASTQNATPITRASFWTRLTPDIGEPVPACTGVTGPSMLRRPNRCTVLHASATHTPSATTTATISGHRRRQPVNPTRTTSDRISITGESWWLMMTATASTANRTTPTTRSRRGYVARLDAVILRPRRGRGVPRLPRYAHARKRDRLGPVAQSIGRAPEHGDRVAIPSPRKPDAQDDAERDDDQHDAHRLRGQVVLPDPASQLPHERRGVAAPWVGDEPAQGIQHPRQQAQLEEHRRPGRIRTRVHPGRPCQPARLQRRIPASSGRCRSRGWSTRGPRCSESPRGACTPRRTAAPRTPPRACRR